MFLYFVVAALTVYCVALTVVVRREINYVRNSINQCWKSIRRCWNDVDDNADDISDIRSEVMKANEVFSDLWDRIDATVDKMLDVRVENILRERDALETKYRDLLQKHNDLAAAYDEYKNKHPEYIEVAEYCDNDVIATEAVFNHLQTVTEIPVAKPNDQVTTCELKVEDDDFVDISDGKDEEA